MAQFKTPPLTVRVKEAARLLGLSRSHLYNQMDAGKLPFRKDGTARLIDYEAIVAYRDSLSVVTPEPPKPTGSLLPADLQQLAVERAREPGPDFNRIFIERLQRLVPSLGEPEARIRAIAHTTRAYRRFHQLDLKTACAAVLSLIESAGLISPVEPPEPDFHRLYFERLELLARDVDEAEAKARSFECVVGLYRTHHKCGLDDAKRAVLAILARDTP